MIKQDTWPFYLIIPFLREGYDSVRWGMIKFKMAMLGYDLVNFRKREAAPKAGGGYEKKLRPKQLVRKRDPAPKMKLCPMQLVEKE